MQSSPTNQLPIDADYQLQPIIPSTTKATKEDNYKQKQRIQRTGKKSGHEKRDRSKQNQQQTPKVSKKQEDNGGRRR